MSKSKKSKTSETLMQISGGFTEKESEDIVKELYTHIGNFLEIVYRLRNQPIHGFGLDFGYNNPTALG